MDGLRALAALSVFGFHIGYLTGGNQYGRFGGITANLSIGVTLFFSISGFLLYRPFVVARRQGNRRSLGQYAFGRVLRIVPAYWVALTLAALYPGVPGVFTSDWWRFYGLAQIYDSRTMFEGLGVAWSLCVEATFYLALPLFAAATWRLGRRRGAVPAEIGLLVLIASAGLLVQQHLKIFTIVPTFIWFVPGMALALIDVVLRERREHAAQPWPGLRNVWVPFVLAALGYALQCLFLSNPRYPTQPITYAHQTAGSVLSSLIALAVLTPVCLPFRSTGRVLKFLTNRAASFLGRISYGIYLYHLVVLVAVYKLGWTEIVAGRTVSYIAVAVPATLVLATASWYVIERPCLALKTRKAKPGLGPERMTSPTTAAATDEPAP